MPIISGLGAQNALGSAPAGMQNVVQAQKQAATTKTQASTKTDKVSINTEAMGAVQQGQQAQSPRMAQIFSPEIESGIGRIQNLISSGKNSPPAGSMLATQKPETTAKGQLAQAKEAQMQSEAKVVAAKEQEFAKKSITSPANASLNAVVQNLSNEQLRRAAPTQQQTQAAGQMVM